MVSDLVNSLLKDAKKNKDYLKGESSLSPSQLNEAATMNKEFMDNLTVREKDIPDALKTRFGRKSPKYDAEKAFKSAYDAMGANLTASTLMVLKALQSQASNIEGYRPTTPAIWRKNRVNSVNAFQEIIVACETANVETSSAFMGIKQQMRVIGQEIEGLRGLPVDVTPQLKAMHEAIVQFDKVSSAQEFEKLFTLQPRDAALAPIAREPGLAGIGGATTSPVVKLRNLRTATGPSRNIRKEYWRQWIGCFDILLLATQSLQQYLALGFNLKRTKGGWMRLMSPAERPVVVSFMGARDTMVRQLTTILNAAGTAYQSRAATDISKLTGPSRPKTEESLEAHVVYINDIISILSTMYNDPNMV